MCLSTVFIEKGAAKEEFMRDVARLEAEDNGFYFVDFFGEKKFVKGSIVSIDLVDEHAIILKPGVTHP